MEELDRINLRPNSFEEFIGHDKLKNDLKVYVDASLQRQEILDHVLIFGPPGLGKTSLAHVIANGLGTSIKEISGPSIERTGDLASILSSLAPGDVLFIDEIHRLDKTIEEVLYSALEDYKLNLVIGKEEQARQISIQLPPFVLVGATTKIGLISKPLRDRFGITINIDYYSIEDLSKIVQRAARVFGFTIEEDAANLIAKCGRGTPRVAINIIRRIRDYMTVEKVTHLDSKKCLNFLEKLGLDDIGLNRNDRRYLSFIKDKFNGGPVGIDLLSKAIGESQDNIEEIIEPYLIKIGFLNRTSKGRMLTVLAQEHIKLFNK